MSASLASDALRAAGACIVAALLLAPQAAQARVHVRVGDDQARVSRVRISDRGVEIGTPGGDSLLVDVGDSIRMHSHAVAIDEGGAGMVRLFSDADVPAGKRVDGDVVAVFGSVRVEGEVTGAAVAVFGSVELAPEASVAGDAVAVGGRLEVPEGSHVGGESVSVGLLPMTFGLPALSVVLMFIGLGWFVSTCFGWLFGSLFPDRLAQVALTSSRRTFLSLVFGLLSVFAMPVIAVLLLVTVIGIPLGLMLPVVYVAMAYAGQLAGTYVLGCKLTRRRIGEGNPMQPMVAGTALIAVFFAIAAFLWTTPGLVRTMALFFSLVGLSLLTGLTAIGTGAFLLSRAGSRPRETAGVHMASAPGAAVPTSAI